MPTAVVVAGPGNPLQRYRASRARSVRRRWRTTAPQQLVSARGKPVGILTSPRCALAIKSRCCFLRIGSAAGEQLDQQQSKAPDRWPWLRLTARACSGAR